MKIKYFYISILLICNSCLTTISPFKKEKSFNELTVSMRNAEGGAPSIELEKDLNAIKDKCEKMANKKIESVNQKTKLTNIFNWTGIFAGTTTAGTGAVAASLSINEQDVGAIIITSAIAAGITTVSEILSTKLSDEREKESKKYEKIVLEVSDLATLLNTDDEATIRAKIRELKIECVLE